MTARTAQNDDVTINVEQAGDNVSKVSVRVGATGDAAVSKQIIDLHGGAIHLGPGSLGGARATVILKAEQENEYENNHEKKEDPFD